MLNGMHMDDFEPDIGAIMVDHNCSIICNGSNNIIYFLLKDIEHAPFTHLLSFNLINFPSIPSIIVEFSSSSFFVILGCLQVFYMVVSTFSDTICFFM